MKLAKLLLHGKQGEKKKVFNRMNRRQKCRWQWKRQKDYVSLRTIVEKINISSEIHQNIFSATVSLQVTMIIHALIHIFPFQVGDYGWFLDTTAQSSSEVYANDLVKHKHNFL